MCLNGLQTKTHHVRFKSNTRNRARPLISTISIHRVVKDITANVLHIKTSDVTETCSYRCNLIQQPLLRLHLDHSCVYTPRLHRDLLRNPTTILSKRSLSYNLESKTL